VIKHPKWQKGLGDASPYLSIGISLAGAMLVYVGIGYLVDRWLGTSPTYLIVGSVAGMISFFIQLFRLTKEMTTREDKRKAAAKKASDSDK
jgi:F0F1-type ATP synthase assembly protein I